MTKSQRFIPAISLIVIFAGLVAQCLQGMRGRDIEIVSAPKTYSAEELRRTLGRPFETTPCASPGKAARTISEALGPDARRLLVHHYEPAWHDIGIVRNYIRRLLDAVPETQQVIDHIHWAEGPTVEIIAFVEFQNGKRRPMEIGNGYAHFEDLGGCEWWARYLGGERSKWVVRP